MDEVEEISKDIGYYSECDDAELDQKLVSELVKKQRKSMRCSGECAWGNRKDSK